MHPTTAHVPAWTIAPRGLDSTCVPVRAHLAESSGLAESGQRERLDRVRAAMRTAQLPWPSWPVQLSGVPSIPLYAAADLAAAAAVLHTVGVVAESGLEFTVLLGELGLDGRVRPARGVMAAALAARRRGFRRVIVPAGSVPEAALVPGLDVRGVAHLTELPALLRDPGVPRPADPVCPAAAIPATAASPGAPSASADPAGELDIASLSSRVCHAVQLAAAGAHPLLLDSTGPGWPGTVRLARVVHALLPELSTQDSLDVTALHSLAGLLDADPVLLRRGAFVAPDRSASRAAFAGGGTGVIRAGAISRAHCGVLYLEDATELGHLRLNSVRIALEEGAVYLAGHGQCARFPARPHLVVAISPCPCGAERAACRCSPRARREHAKRLPGGFRAQMDLRLTMPGDAAEPACGESMQALQARVATARERVQHRWPGYLNVEVPQNLLTPRHLDDAVTAPLREHVRTGALAARGADRALRLAWTIADLAARPAPTAEDVITALAFRGCTTP